MRVRNIVISRRRQHRCGQSQTRFFCVLIALLMLFGSNHAWSLPDNPRDPPLPPSTAGNLYETGRFTVHSCRVGTKTATQATIHFVSNFARTEVSYWEPTATWSAWQTITGTSYACTAPNCLWGGAQVRIRGCDSGGVCQAPGCTVRLGVTPGGPPAIAPVALPAASTTVAGCVQTNHPTVRFEARWVGAPASGYPQAVDENGNGLTLTQISRVTIGGVEVGTYMVPAPTGLSDGALWRFTFSLSASRQSQSTVQVRDNCLMAPIVQQVDASNNALALANGQQVQSTANLRLSVTSGNPGLGLTSPALTPTQAFDTPFNAPSVSTGNTQTLSWIESGNAWDGLTYRSPPGTVEITGAPCQSGLSASYWITGSDEINLADDTTWMDGPLVETNACTPVSPGAPSAGPDIGVAVDWQAIPEGSGWRVQARAAQNLGLVSSTADYTGGLWGSGVTLQALRPSPGSCPAGERLVGGICEPCPNYQVCSGGALTMQQWCNAGSPPASASVFTYQDCVAGTTQAVSVCLDAGDPSPADTPCPVCTSTEQLVENAGVWSCRPLNCPPGERPVSGVCEACPDYQICSGGSLTTQQWCNAGNPPTDAVEVQYQDCVGGTTQTVTACLAPGDTAPSDSPCPACESDPALVSWWLSSTADVELPESTAWVAGPTVMTNACPGVTPTDPRGNRNDSAFRFTGGNVVDGWSTEVSALQAQGEVNEIYYWFDTGWDINTSNWYFFVERDGVTSCPTGQRIVGGRCEACPTYQVCSGGSLVSQEWCNAGNPPGDASMVSYQACQSGTTVSVQACVDPGGTAPANSPCVTTCQAGERMVSGVCEPCPTYYTCSATQGLAADIERTDLLISNTFCDPGNPPNSVSTTWNMACVNGTARGVWQCIGEGGLSSNPGDVGCPGETCIDYDACRSSSAYSERDLRVNMHQCAVNPVPGPTRQIFQRVMCLYAGTPSEYSVYRYHCVGEGGLASAADVPADDWCTSDCGSSTYYYVCTADMTTGSESLRTLQLFCDSSSNKPDASATEVTRQACIDGTTTNATLCIGYGGLSSDPGDQPCGVTCDSDERLVGGSCQACPTYYACNGNNRVQRTWCNAGSPPANAQSASFQSCVGGTTVTTNTCVPPGGSAPADDPCPTSCAADERLVGGTCEPCPTYESCSGNNLVTLSWCNAGNPPADSRVVSYQDCQGGSTVTLQACLNSGQSAPADNPCSSSCPAGERLVSGRCETCPTYKVCFGNGLATRNWCSSGNPPADARTNTYQACVGGSTVTEQECLNPGDTPTPDSPCTSCPPGQELVSGSCVPCSSTETYCSGGTKLTRTIAECADRDSRPVICPSGQEMNAVGCCVPCSAMEQYCDSNGVERTRTIAGCSDVDSRSATEQYCSGGVSRSRTVSGVCGDTDTRSATETYCIGSTTATRTVTGTCTDTDTRSATRTYCSGGSALTQTIAACFDDDDRPLSCPSGMEMNAEGCCESCADPGDPSSCPSEGYAWEWDQATCRHRMVQAAECADDEVSDGWLSGTCTWDCVAQVSLSACSSITEPTSKADCTAPNQSVLPAHGFRLKDDGWYSYRTSTGLGLGSGGTVLPGSESLCIPCDGTP